ncbi:unnamed protein product [Symbiodinium sp. CCMP2592]|nr:unnamed protein product [Symbiodinium sp. CCMP2592]
MVPSPGQEVGLVAVLSQAWGALNADEKAGVAEATLEFIMNQTEACHKIAAPALSHMCLQHMVSCDSDSRVRYWLRQTQRMKHLSLDINECCDIAFWDELQASFQPTPKTSLQQWYHCKCNYNFVKHMCSSEAGSSQLRSRRNPKRKFDALESGSGRTAESFHKFLEYLEEQKPNYFYSEIVHGSMDHDRSLGSDNKLSDHSSTIQMFADKGYLVTWQKVCPRQCGVPMSRPRVHYQGLRVDSLPAGEAQRRMSNLKAAWDRLTGAQYKQMGLSDFLVGTSPDDGDFSDSGSYFSTVLEKAQQKSEKPKPSSGADAKWKVLHSQLFKQHEARCLLFECFFRLCRVAC